VRHVAQAKGNRHAVEVVVGKRQFLGIALSDPDQGATVVQAVAAAREHGVVDIGQPDLTAAAQLSGEGQGQVAGAPGHVEHPGVFADATLGDRKRLSTADASPPT
jgi:hypothetical protein